MPGRQVQEQHEPGAAFHQGADRRVTRADDQVAFPVPGHRPVIGLGWPLADHHHVLDPAAPLISLPARLAQRPAGPQAGRQLPAQRTAALHVDRLVDGLVRHPHLRLIGESSLQHHADLLWRPPLGQPGLHPVPQRRVAGQLRRLRPPRPRPRVPLGRHRPVLAMPPGIAAHLPAHRRRRTAQPRRDRPQRLTRRQPDRDLLPLGHRQIPAAQRPRPVPLHPARTPEPSISRPLGPRRYRRFPPRHARPHPIPELQPHRPRHRRTSAHVHNDLHKLRNRCKDQLNPPRQTHSITVGRRCAPSEPERTSHCRPRTPGSPWRERHPRQRDRAPCRGQRRPRLQPRSGRRPSQGE